jgi:hypothetical protein
VDMLPQGKAWSGAPRLDILLPRSCIGETSPRSPGSRPRMRKPSPGTAKRGSSVEDCRGCIKTDDNGPQDRPGGGELCSLPGAGRRQSLRIASPWTGKIQLFLSSSR